MKIISEYYDSKFSLLKSFRKWRIQMLQHCFKYCKQEGMGAYSPLAPEEGLGSLFKICFLLHENLLIFIDFVNINLTLGIP